MGILVVVLILAGQVMTLTVESTGQAKALTEVNQAMRTLEYTLRKDLAGVRRPGPGVDEPSLMLIQGNPINAYWTRDEMELGGVIETPPRADILMFFTRGEARTYVQYQWPNLLPDNAMRSVSNPTMDGWKQVVYGHANLGEYVENTPPDPPYIFEPGSDAFVAYDPTVPDPETSPVPAAEWHLARRMVHLNSWAPPDPDDPDQQIAEPPWPMADLDPGLGDPESRLAEDVIVQGETDVIANFDYVGFVVGPPDGNAPLGGWPRYMPLILDDLASKEPHRRSELDPTPPPQYIDRLGHYFIPNCASFKVEWALDPDSEFVGGRLVGEKRIHWFDQGDKADPSIMGDVDSPFRSLEEELDGSWRMNNLARYGRLRRLLNDKLGGESPDTYSLLERFKESLIWFGGPGWPHNLAVFAANRVSASGDLIPEEIFPSMLRITVELYDDERRLKKPIRHVMIIPVGSD